MHLRPLVFAVATLLFSMLVCAPEAPAEAAGRQAARAPTITEVYIDKAQHTLALKAGDKVVRQYRVALGSGGAGPKRFEGDRVTPVGTYRIGGRIPGLFHRFLVVTYPNEEDRARFQALKKEGIVPKGRGIGYGIGIHGVGIPNAKGVHKESDWTLGCIAVDDEEIDEIAALVRDGTVVRIVDGEATGAAAR
jgi:murein L,D-transpeptidase YafK